ncbi:unnamed protein product [Mycena citricolor]|uniref:Uncharacterized protein n=1 Tax=Mycena citricolor TaxID=2018698 RepID=A0AAD2HS85_9AGAR|nr:unnamed protein product [Mycena citricolor]
MTIFGRACSHGGCSPVSTGDGGPRFAFAFDVLVLVGLDLGLGSAFFFSAVWPGGAARASAPSASRTFDLLGMQPMAQNWSLFSHVRWGCVGCGMRCICAIAGGRRGRGRGSG